MATEPQDSTSVEDYRAMENASEGRHEYIDGHIYLMSGGTLNHARIGSNVVRALGDLVEAGPCRAYASDARVRLSETRVVYPDASVTCDEQDQGVVDEVRSARLIVEVLSPTTEAYDRGKKFEHYSDCPTVEEYMLVDAQRQAVWVYYRDEGAQWSVRLYGPGADIELRSVGATVLMSAFYRGITFKPSA